MKPTISRLFFILDSVLHPLFDNLLRRVKPVAYLMLLFGLVCFTSCLPQYYKVNTKNKVDADSLRHMVNEHKYFILHADQQDFALTEIKVDSNHVNAKTDSLPIEYLRFLQPNNQKAKRYHAKDKEYVLNAVRLYTSGSVKYNEQISIPLKNISKMDLYQFNKAKTTWTHIGVIGGITLGVAAIVIFSAAYTSPY